jgi:DNA-binding NtrC family response regulator
VSAPRRDGPGRFDSELPAARILIADADRVLASALASNLRALGHAPECAPSPAAVMQMLSRAAEANQPFDVLLCDPGPADHDAQSLRALTREHPETPVIVLAAYGTVESAVEALRLGAADYLVKPIVDAELHQSLARALRQRALLAENYSLRRRLRARASLEGLIGSDPRMQRLFDLIRAVADSRTTVLMTGESGTGKSLFAHAIHAHSPRRAGPFVELSCGSIPESLLESELFGHVKGSFTGAYADKVGRFQAAHGGTIFLDEINSASPAMQLKLLRVLQERRFEPVGSNQTVEVDVRVVLATNQPLEHLVATGAFRQDLFYRINVVKVEIPPLRDRPGDIPLLAAAFLERHAADLSRQIVGFSAEAMDALRRYHYPGNVRELQNIVERAAVLCRGQTVTLDDLPPPVLESGPPRAADRAQPDGPWEPMPLDRALLEPERRIILRALDANGWNRQKTSEQLAINRTTLYKKMKQFGLLGPDRLVG